MSPGSSAQPGCAWPCGVCLFLQVGRGPLDPARSRRLELFPLAAGRGHAVLDRLADRVLGIGDHGPRFLRGLPCALDPLAAPQLDGLAAQAFYLLTTGTGRDVGADRDAHDPPQDEPNETPA